MKIKKGDTVKVIAGKDKDKEGKVIAVNKKDGKVLVEGVNMLTKHTKPSAANQNGGIVHQEGYIDASNVMYVHKGQATQSRLQDGWTTRKFVSQRRPAKLLINSRKEVQDFE